MSLLASEWLEAFAAVAAERSFTRGARRIGLTQPAVSQRIRKLEEQLRATVFQRRRDQVKLTAEGEALLGYVRSREGLEAELLARVGAVAATEGAHVGVLRVGGFSSVTRSIVLPALTPIVRDNDGATLHVFVRELRDLPTALRSGEADLVLTDRLLEETGVESSLLGHETYVLVEPIRGGRSAYLDHDAEDTITDRFARHNRLDLRGAKRLFLGDNYGILDGVARGWGRAVVAAHVVASPPYAKSVRIVPRHSPLLMPVYLHARIARHRTALERAAVDALARECKRVLAPAAATRSRT